METIQKYFPELGALQLRRLEMLLPFYREWNAQINLISRKDLDAFYLHHVLHSMAIMKFIRFRPGTTVIDAGTGGGFPGIPLAICFPGSHFLLVDSIAKKIRVLERLIHHLGLDNVLAIRSRVEDVNEHCDFVVSRAVAALPVLWKWVGSLIRPGKQHELENGLLCLKGGELSDEIQGLGVNSRLYPLQAHFDESYFQKKQLVHVFDRWRDDSGRHNK